MLKEGVYMTVGERIAQFREESGISQRQLAKKSGISASAICQYESGKRLPDLKCFIAICNTFKVRTDMFLKGVTI